MQCPDCEITIQRKKDHFKQMHGQCSQCTYSTSNKPNMKRHLQAKHVKGVNINISTQPKIATSALAAQNNFLPFITSISIQTNTLASLNKPAENSEEPALNGDERAEVEPCLTAFPENLDTYLFRHPEVDKIIRPPSVGVNSGRLWGPGAEKKRKVARQLKSTAASKKRKLICS